jgi:hypothetical protein
MTPMTRLQATSRCECQALLSAILDEKRQVIEGSAHLHGAKETAPAHSIGAAHDDEGPWSRWGTLRGSPKPTPFKVTGRDPL